MDDKSGQDPEEKFKQEALLALRQRAEVHVRSESEKLKANLAVVSKDAMVDRLHELRVHQIELEMQNEELRSTQFKLENSRARFFELYDLAPVGYCTMNQAGLILQANLMAATLLGETRDALVGQLIYRFILKSDQDIFYLSRQREAAELESTPHVCELRMQQKEGAIIWIELATNVVQDDSGSPILQITMNDISKRKQIEAALMKSEERYRSLVNEVQTGIIVQLPDSAIVFANQSALDLLGLTESQLLGKTCFDTSWNIIQEDGSIFPAEMHPLPRAIEMRTPVRNVMMGVYQPIARKRVWLLVSALPQINAMGHVQQVICTFSDITERKLAQDANLAYQEALLVAQRIGHIGSWEWNALTDVVTGSDQLYALLDVDKSALLTLDDHKKVFDADSIRRLDNAVEKALSSGEPYQIELTLVKAKDATRYVVGRGEAVKDAKGRIIGLRGALQDVTEQKAFQEEILDSKKRLKKLVESAMDAIIVLDESLLVVLYNAAAEKLFGVGPEEAIGTPIERFMPQRFRAGHASHVHSFGNEGVTSRSMGRLGQVIALRANGDEFPVEASISQFEVEGKKQYTVIMRDISERKRIEHELHSSLQEKTSLLNEVHHRVKNNLQVITSLLRLEAGRSSEPDTQVVLNDMQGRIRSMALLHESLYRTGIFASINLGAYLGDLATQAFRAQAVGSGAIRLQLNLAEVQVSIDQAMPCGLLVNELISNCFKHGFTDGRGGEVRVALHYIEGANQIQVQVSDTGCGLPADFEERRDDSLGMQLATDLAGQLGGRLIIGEGPGAKFGVTFTVDMVRL